MSAPPVVLSPVPGSFNENDSGLLLYCHASATDVLAGSWQFSLQSRSGETLLQAEDADAGDLNRLILLCAVRGLEAIDGAATVTLLSTSRYLIRSMSEALPRWRAGNFQWEHFGRFVEVQHSDLWRRIDRALTIHTVAACLVQTQLVSPHASADAAAVDSIGDEVLRLDRRHSRGGLKGPRGRRNRNATGNAVNRPSDSAMGDNPLRRMLAAKVTPPSRRFTAEQLAEA